MQWTLQWAGTLTYALYVIHGPIFGALRSVLPAGLLTARQSFSYFPIALGTVILLSLGAYVFIEHPFEMKKKLVGTALMDAP